VPPSLGSSGIDLNFFLGRSVEVVAAEDEAFPLAVSKSSTDVDVAISVARPALESGEGFARGGSTEVEAFLFELDL